MTTPRVPPRPCAPLRRLGTTALVTAALLGAGGTAAAAAPVPPEPSCAQVLARAAQWPGSIRVDGQTVRLYSDAYASRLAGSAACTAPGA
ncbi:hypothetical protein [Trujillonella humicola]|uniref:hypothetical protein n=1 Tax=Trujillonella humicola TaxID=3383699 RepID=UPI0039059BD4